MQHLKESAEDDSPSENELSDTAGTISLPPTECDTSEMASLPDITNEICDIPTTVALLSTDADICTANDDDDFDDLELWQS